MLLFYSHPPARNLLVVAIRIFTQTRRNTKWKETKKQKKITLSALVCVVCRVLWYTRSETNYVNARLGRGGGDNTIAFHYYRYQIERGIKHNVEPDSNDLKYYIRAINQRWRFPRCRCLKLVCARARAYLFSFKFVYELRSNQ